MLVGAQPDGADLQHAPHPLQVNNPCQFPLSSAYAHIIKVLPFCIGPAQSSPFSVSGINILGVDLCININPTILIIGKLIGLVGGSIEVLFSLLLGHPAHQPTSFGSM